MDAAFLLCTIPLVHEAGHIVFVEALMMKMTAACVRLCSMIASYDPVHERGESTDMNKLLTVEERDKSPVTGRKIVVNSVIQEEMFSET